MAYTTEELANATVAAKEKLAAKASWATAARTALKGKGIFNQNDIERRTKDILSELGRRGQLVARSRRTRTHV